MRTPKLKHTQPFVRRHVLVAPALGFATMLGAAVAAQPIPPIGFTATVQVAIGGPALDAALGDVNGDGALDLVVAGPGSSVSVALATGPAAFAPAAAFPVGATVNHNAISVALGDFNLDGLPDIAARCTGYPVGGPSQVPSHIAVILGTGGGAFGPPSVYLLGQVAPLPIAEAGLAAADFDGDGDTDLVCGGSLGTLVVCNLGPGAGLGTFSSTPLLLGTIPPSAIAAGNVAGVLPDVLTATAGALNVNLAAAPSGPPCGAAFAAPVAIVDPAPNAIGLVLADLDNDTDLDAAICDGVSSAVTAFVNAAGVYAVASAIPPGAGGSLCVAAADLDGDGLADLLYGTGTNFTVLRNTTAGVLSVAPAGQFSAQGAAVNAIASADLNGDGNIDIVTAEASGNAVAYINFTPFTAYAISVPQPAGCSGLVLTTTVPFLGQPMGLSVSGGPAGAAGFLGYSQGPPIGAPIVIGPGSCLLYVNPLTLVLPPLAIVLLDQNGNWGITVSLPPATALAGTSFQLQVAVVNAAGPSGIGFSFSNGINARFGF